jgi:DNA-binding transcriptional MerR regulator/trans-aconitate methyltransferase
LYRISELAKEVGLSRTTLLYYEKLKLIAGQRMSNGYRTYNDSDIQRIRLIQLLQNAGLTLKECKACLEAKIDKKLLQSRLEILEKEIEYKQQSREYLQAMLGGGTLRTWHEMADKLAPKVHLDWLNKQGFDEKEALRLKWLSKDMNEHERYMADFMKVFETLDRWGPGSESETLKALALLPKTPENILEIGCGKGVATLTLARNSAAYITAVDNEQSALDALNVKLNNEGLSSRVKPAYASMTELNFPKGSFDLIWCESSAYVMGVINALKQWRPMLEKNGFLVLSDLVWLTDTPGKEATEFWSKEYPDIQTTNTRITEIKAIGYEVLAHFTISHEAFKNYYEPLRQRTAQLMPEMQGSAALRDISNEIGVFDKHFGEYGYEMFILKA